MKRLRNYYLCDCAAHWSDEADHSCSNECPDCGREVECYDSIVLAYDAYLIVSGAPGASTIDVFPDKDVADEQFHGHVYSAWVKTYPDTPFPPLISLAAERLRNSEHFNGLLELTKTRVPHDFTYVNSQIDELHTPVWFSLDPTAIAHHKAGDTRAAADNGRVQVLSFSTEAEFKDHLEDLQANGHNVSFRHPEFNS